MKPHCRIILTILAITLNLTAYSEIKNGYECKIKLAVENLEYFDSLEQVYLKLDQQQNLRTIRYWSRWVQKKHDKYVKMYILTQNYLASFKTISPIIYNSIDSIQDKNGNITDVYVMIIEENSFQEEGIVAVTNLDQCNDNIHTYHSDYGHRSVSLIIERNSQRKILELMAHEFGHVLYQVPNLASYIEYFNKTYDDTNQERGHFKEDPSHHSVKKTLDRYWQSYINYQSIKRENRKKNESNEIAFNRQ